MNELAVLVAVIVLALTGCGKDDDVDVNPDKGDDVPTKVDDGGEKED
jgi:hypothetical protein